MSSPPMHHETGKPHYNQFFRTATCDIWNWVVQTWPNSKETLSSQPGFIPITEAIATTYTGKVVRNFQVPFSTTPSVASHCTSHLYYCILLHLSGRYQLNLSHATYQWCEGENLMCIDKVHKKKFGMDAKPLPRALITSVPPKELWEVVLVGWMHWKLVSRFQRSSRDIMPDSTSFVGNSTYPIIPKWAHSVQLEISVNWLNY